MDIIIMTKKCNCPKCGKELIRLQPYMPGVYIFWCNDCDIDITIQDRKEMKKYKMGIGDNNE